jgi:Putative auto-transporter adhesin, head GIN domain
MKNSIFIFFVMIVLSGCNSENAWDCFQSSGDIVQQEFDMDKFKKIIVWNRVQLFISYGPEQKVIVETGENLMNEIRVRVEDSILKVSDRNSCNYTREYGITKVYVTTGVDSLEIRNSSGLTTTGIGPIKFKKLTLTSEDRAEADEFHIDGDFRFDELDVQQLIISANGLSKFYLKGKTVSGNFGMYDSDVRIEAGELEMQNLYLFHRSTNKMIVKPSLLIQGIITGLGDVICLSNPPIVNVEERFTGELIFQ